MEKIIVTIPLHGNTTIEVQGKKGPACQDLTRDLEAALGGTVTNTPTGEMYETEEALHLDQ